ncbi:MAG: hypothetical protein VX836_00810 [Pseudomonadota bacterium]|jgi:hypothetical protein|nr:hypothetical protein [Pseudomonadota bacterium]
MRHIVALASLLVLLSGPLAAQSPIPPLGDGWTQTAKDPMQLQWQGDSAADRMSVTLYPPTPSDAVALEWLDARIAQMAIEQALDYQDCHGGDNEVAEVALRFCTIARQGGGELLAGFVATTTGSGDIALITIVAAQTQATRERLLADLRALSTLARNSDTPASTAGGAAAE